jgi:hypothetical protein
MSEFGDSPEANGLGRMPLNLYRMFTRFALLFTVSLLGKGYAEGITSLQEVAMVERTARVLPQAFLPEPNI